MQKAWDARLMVPQVDFAVAVFAIVEETKGVEARLVVRLTVVLFAMFPVEVGQLIVEYPAMEVAGVAAGTTGRDSYAPSHLW